MCQAQFLDSGDTTVSNTKSCEMKYFLPYRWARNVTAIHDFWPPNVNGGSQKGTLCQRSGRCRHPPKAIAEEWG